MDALFRYPPSPPQPQPPPSLDLNNISVSASRDERSPPQPQWKLTIRLSTLKLDGWSSSDWQEGGGWMEELISRLGRRRRRPHRSVSSSCGSWFDHLTLLTRIIFAYPGLSEPEETLQTAQEG